MSSLSIHPSPVGSPQSRRFYFELPFEGEFSAHFVMLWKLCHSALWPESCAASGSTLRRILPKTLSEGLGADNVLFSWSHENTIHPMAQPLKNASTRKVESC